MNLHCRGEVSDYVMMEGRGFGFVTYKDPTSAQRFLEVGILRRLSHWVQVQASIYCCAAYWRSLTCRMLTGRGTSCSKRITT